MGLQAVEVTVGSNFVRPVGTDSHHLHTPPIEFSAKLFQSTQLADTVGSPVRPEELYQYQVAIERAGIEGLLLVIQRGEVRDGVPYLD